MGYPLRRMIRDGAPATWTVSMRLVAMEIADSARELDGGSGESTLPAPVLMERTGLTRRSVSRALADLARSGYEMRRALGTDRRGRPVFATRGHRLTFQVPPLPPREPPGGDR